MQAREAHPNEGKRMPGVVLDCGLPHTELFRSQPRLEGVSAERAQRDRSRGGERAECQENLQAGFLVLFFARCGRFLP
jgi:hypothetical protein